jgi:hypothetical protein
MVHHSSSGLDPYWQDGQAAETRRQLQVLLVEFGGWGIRRLWATIFCQKNVSDFSKLGYKVEPPFDSVQLVNITPITMVYGTYNYS